MVAQFVNCERNDGKLRLSIKTIKIVCGAVAGGDIEMYILPLSARNKKKKE